MVFNSAKYWSERYACGSTSGSGSYGRLAAYKADFLNTFVMENAVQSVVELGCGDGNQLALSHYPLYVGFDVSDEALELCQKKFNGDNTKFFLPMKELEEKGADAFPAELTLSLDVIYHLIEDDVYQNYMKHLFDLSLKYVVLYAPHTEYTNGYHVRMRPFLHDIDYERWELINSLDNPFAWDPEALDSTSFARFYVFARKDADGVIIPSIGSKALYRLNKDDVDAFQAIQDALLVDTLQKVKPLELVHHYIEQQKALPRFLDLGCGNGNSFVQLQQMQIDVDWTGCDIDDSDEVRSRTDTDQHFVPFDGVHLPFEDGSFDIVYSNQVFERVEQPRELMREIARVLHPDGYCIGSVSQLEPYHSRSISQFTTYGLMKLAEQAGLRVERFGLGVDALTLLNRRMDSRNPGYGRYMNADASATYAAIARADAEYGEDERITLYKQLICAGQFTFVLSFSGKERKRFATSTDYIQTFHAASQQHLIHINVQTFNKNWHVHTRSIQMLSPKKPPSLLVSLTSYPERIPRLHITLYSLLQQSLKPDALILWLAREEFPNEIHDLPEQISNLRQFGLEIRFCENLFSYKKIIPALREYPDAILATADDDVFYPQHWLAKLFAAYKRDPCVIHTYCSRRVTFDTEGKLAPYLDWDCILDPDESASFLHFPVGVAGILYPPDSFHRDVMRLEQFLSLSPGADDLWLWAMALLKGTPVHVLQDQGISPMTTYPERDLGLAEGNTLFNMNACFGNDMQVLNLIEAYPQLLPILKQAWKEDQHSCLVKPSQVGAVTEK